MRISAKTLKTGSPLPDRHTTADAAKKPCREYSFLWNYARLLGWKSTYFAYKKGGDINNTRDVFSQILWRLPLDFQRFALEQGLSSFFKAIASLRSTSPPEASPRRNENSLAT